MQNSEQDNSLIVSFITLRRLIGFLGIALPLSALVYSFIVTQSGATEATISTYYHTGLRDIFVGILCATGVFMLVYKGFDLRDTIASSIAGACAIFVAFFRTGNLPGGATPIHDAISVTHVTAAAGLFLTFAYMSVFLFTKSGGRMTKQKKKRNAIYRICGYTIFACIA